MFVAVGVWFAHAVPGKVWYPATDLQVRKWTEWTTSPLLAQWVREVNSSPNPNLSWSYSLWVLWAFPCREPLTSSPGLPGLPLDEVCASLPSLGTMQQDPALGAGSTCYFFAFSAVFPHFSVIYDALSLVLSLEFSILFYFNTHLQHHMGALSTSPPDSEAAVIFINRSQSKFLRC